MSNILHTLLASIALLAGCLLPVLTWADDSVDDKLRLGRKFAERQEWYRAATLLEEAALDSTGPAAQIAWIEAAEAHAGARQWERAAELFQEAATWSTLRADIAWLRAAQCFDEGAKYRLAKELLLRHGRQLESSPLYKEAMAQLSLAAAGQGDYATARASFAKLAVISPAQRENWLALEKEADPHRLARKSKMTAGVLSAILPGAGQAYAGHYGDAAMSFAVNAVLGLLVWDALLKARDLEQRPHRGWAYTTPALFIFIGSSFYIGNIYGAASAADKRNRQGAERLQDSLREKTRDTLANDGKP